MSSVTAAAVDSAAFAAASTAAMSSMTSKDTKVIVIRIIRWRSRSSVATFGFGVGTAPDTVFFRAADGQPWQDTSDPGRLIIVILMVLFLS